MSVIPDHRETYKRVLSQFTGDAFEREVVTALQQTLTGFQRIPRKPDGDGGVDGLCDGHETAYCCYGPETTKTPGLTDAQHRKQLTDKIVTKFTADLMRIFEVEADGQSAYKEKPNAALEGILGNSPSTKIKTIKLVCNWFDSTRIIGGIKKHLAKIRKASRCRFVHGKCDFVVWGPEDVASNVVISQHTMVRIEHPGLLLAVEGARAAAVSHEPQDADEFDAKFDDLKNRLPSQAAAAVDQIRQDFRWAWSTSIKLDERLATELPALHQAYEAARKSAALDARLASIGSGEAPAKLIDSSRKRLRERMEQLVEGGLTATLSEELATAETGRLIGECPLDWRVIDAK